MIGICEEILSTTECIISHKSQESKNKCSVLAQLMAGFIPSLRFAKREGFSPYRLIKEYSFGIGFGIPFPLRTGSVPFCLRQMPASPPPSGRVGSGAGGIRQKGFTSPYRRGSVSEKSLPTKAIAKSFARRLSLPFMALYASSSPSVVKCISSNSNSPSSPVTAQR